MITNTHLLPPGKWGSNNPRLPDIIRYRNQRMTTAEIGKLVGMTKQRVHQLLQKYAPELAGHKSSQRPGTVEALQYAQLAADRLLTADEIKAEKGWSPGTQARWFNRIGLPARHTDRVLRRLSEVSPVLWERFPSGKASVTAVQMTMKDVFKREFSVHVAQRVRTAAGLVPTRKGE
jgi:hypothetical protein